MKTSGARNVTYTTSVPASRDVQRNDHSLTSLYAHVQSVAAWRLAVFQLTVNGRSERFRHPVVVLRQIREVRVNFFHFLGARQQIVNILAWKMSEKKVKLCQRASVYYYQFSTRNGCATKKMNKAPERVIMEISIKNKSKACLLQASSPSL